MVVVRKPRPSSIQQGWLTNMRRYQAGLSIVELMIAMALSLLLGVGIFQVFISNQQSARLTQALTQVQDTGRLTLDMMSRDIRNADYWGCASNVSRVNNKIDTTGTGYDSDIHGWAIGANQSVNGFDNVAANTTIGGQSVREGTDVLELRSLASQGLSINQAMPQPSANLFFTNAIGVSEGDVLAVSDCESADVFQVVQVNTQGAGQPGDNVNHNSGGSVSPGNAQNGLSKIYPIGSQVLIPTFRRYYVNVDADGVSRLMLRDETGTNAVLAENVEDLQFQYGLDTNSDEVVDRFENAATIAADASLDFTQVLSITTQIRVASSQTNVVETGIQYSWNNDTALSADEDEGRLRRVFSSIASIRSRLP